VEAHQSQERTTFVKIICEHPNDDTPRLVFADWLTENGEEEYGAFIRVQVALAKMPRFVHLECDVCGNTADDEGELRHGRGCFVIDEDGGGSEFAEESPAWLALRRRERELFHADDRRTLDWFGLPQPWARIARLTPFDETPRDYPYAVVRRGFVAEVSAPLATLIGGPCEYHRGPVVPAPEHVQRSCRLCTPGCAADLFGSHPVQSVTLTDREPVELSPNLRRLPWTFAVADDPNRQNAIPWDLFEAGGAREWHRTRDEAMAWLSAACVAHGRALAGLSNSAARL
jgi:uncharacterized protein (TIGR02996 family)